MRPFWLTARRLAPLALVAILAYTAGRQHQRATLRVCSELARNYGKMIDMYDLANTALWAGLGIEVKPTAAIIATEGDTP